MSPIFSPSYRASQCCLTSVEAIHALCAYVKVNSLLGKVGPQMVFSIWVAARLLLVHCSTSEQEMDPKLELFVTILRELGTYWGTATRYSQLLQRVLDEVVDSAHGKEAGAGERPASRSLTILADMRRCAYDLDVLMSKQPRQGQDLQHGGRLQGRNAAKVPATRDLEYLDVFEFFNVPKLPTNVAGAGAGATSQTAAGGQSHGAEQGTAETMREYSNGAASAGWDQGKDWFVAP